MKNKKNFFSILKSQRGFNLVEMMIATGISGFVALSASTLYLFIIDNFRIIVDQNTAQESVLWTAFQTKSWLQQGYTFVNPVGGCDNVAVGGITSAVAGGKTSSGIGLGCTELYFQFDKESSSGGSGLSRIAQIGVFNAHNELDITAGDANFNRGIQGKVVMFRSNANVNVTDNLAMLNLANSVWFDRISQYDITGTTVDTSGNTNSITVTIQGRYFFQRTDNPLLNYCFPANVGCNPANTNNSYSNISMVVNTGLRNMGFNQATGGLHGNIYYYRFSAPPILLGIDYQ